MIKILENKIALVTGTSHGLGKRILTVLDESGAKGLGFDSVVGADSLPENWIFHQGNVSLEADALKAVEKIRHHFGRLDIVVANAGLVPPWCEVEALDMSQWDEVFAVNVRGVVITMKHAVPLMKNTGGSMILMGSLNSRRGHSGMTLYTSTKHAVLGIVRASAQDLGSYNIRVNALGPGPIATDALLARIATRAEQGGLPVQTALRQHESETSLGRMATEDEVAKTALFLASDNSSGITGQIFPIDAGLA